MTAEPPELQVDPHIRDQRQKAGDPVGGHRITAEIQRVRYVRIEIGVLICVQIKLASTCGTRLIARGSIPGKQECRECLESDGLVVLADQRAVRLVKVL